MTLEEEMALARHHNLGNEERLVRDADGTIYREGWRGEVRYSRAKLSDGERQNVREGQ